MNAAHTALPVELPTPADDVIEDAPQVDSQIARLQESASTYRNELARVEALLIRARRGSYERAARASRRAQRLEQEIKFQEDKVNRLLGEDGSIRRQLSEKEAEIERLTTRLECAIGREEAAKAVLAEYRANPTETEERLAAAERSFGESMAAGIYGRLD